MGTGLRRSEVATATGKVPRVAAVLGPPFARLRRVALIRATGLDVLSGYIELITSFVYERDSR